MHCAFDNGSLVPSETYFAKDAEGSQLKSAIGHPRTLAWELLCLHSTQVTPNAGLFLGGTWKDLQLFQNANHTCKSGVCTRFPSTAQKSHPIVNEKKKIQNHFKNDSLPPIPRPPPPLIPHRVFSPQEMYNTYLQDQNMLFHSRFGN